MKRNTLIVLCSLIAVLAAIIVAGVSYLYSGVDSETKPAADQTVVDKAEVADTDPMEEDAQSEPEAASEKSPEKQPEQPSAVKAAAPAEFTVTNCGTGKQNTIRQNADNSLELIDEKGKSLWKMSLPGQIAGAVGQVDYYSNGQIPSLSCQGNKLHLVDRLVDSGQVGWRRQLGERRTEGLLVIDNPPLPQQLFHYCVHGNEKWRIKS